MKKYRKGISPIISTMFLLGIFLTAISVSMGVIYPYLLQIDDQISLSEMGSSLELIDDNIRSLITKAPGSTTSIILQSNSGNLYADTQSKTNFFPKAAGSLISGLGPITLNFTRLIIGTPIQSNLYPAGSHQYLRGSSVQDYFSLDSVTQSTTPWGILNLTRPLGSENINISLGYRYLLSTSFSSSNDVVTTVTYFNFNFIGNTQQPVSNNEIQITYNGLTEYNSLFYDNVPFENNVELEMIVSLAGENNVTETPFSLDGGSYGWYIVFRYYDFDILF